MDEQNNPPLKELKPLSDKEKDKLLAPLLQQEPTEFYKIKKPKEDFSKYLGRPLRCMDGETVTIEKIVGSLVYPTRFEINSTHHIVILDFYKQMNHDKSITEDQINAFDKMDHFVESQKKEAMDGNPKEVDSH